jgi:hypothetical protein
VVEVEITARKVSGSVIQGNGAWMNLFLPLPEGPSKNQKGHPTIKVNGKGGQYQLTPIEHNENICASCSNPEHVMNPSPQSEPRGADELEAAVDQAIAACGGDARDAIRALIVANDFLEFEVSELMKAVSHAYARGRFQTYSG